MTRSILPVSVLMLSGLFTVSSLSDPTEATQVLLTRNGKAVSCIAITSDASDVDRKAAAELQRYVKAISGAVLKIVEGKEIKGLQCIWIGSSGHARGFPMSINWERLEDDGFTIRSEGKRILIAGGKKRGSLYAVYTLLETRLGCRKYSPTVEVIPKRRTIILPPLDITQVPKLKFRDGCWYDPGYTEWHKLDNHDELFGLYAHTFARLVPPDRYFEAHPEYYTKTRAGRVADAQLCLTNPDVERIVVDRLREYMNGNPKAKYWSVSQNDTFNPCECDACRSIDSVEGSHSGTLLSFVNRIAEQFPDKVISTLAYQYSRSAPKNIKPRENVNIMLCSIECNRSRPLETDSLSVSFRRDVETWTSLTKNIYLWDYVVQFRNLLSPFPNLRVLQPNIQYFAKNGMTALFEQGSGTVPNEFKELRTYLIAKSLWDPEIKIDSVLDDFLQGYYGNAAPAIRKYIDTMHNALEASGENLGIYGFPLPSKSGYLSASLMDQYVVLFEEAEESVKNDTVLLQRVRVARLPLQFALLEQAKLYGTTERGFFEKVSDSRWRAKPALETLLKTFVNRCKEFGIPALNEIGTTPDDYLRWSEEFLLNSMQNFLALYKPVKLKDPASTKYHDGDESALTDGLKGLDDYHLNWLGFRGVDMEATIDLGSSKSIRRVRTDFLQDINAWIFIPRSVEFSISNDGREFQRVVEIQRAIPQDRKGIWRVPFVGEFSPLQGRYVRVKATSLKQCPDWHKGAGELCWIFADEIVVE